VGGDTIRLWVKDEGEKSAWVKEIHEAVQTQQVKFVLEANIKQNKLLEQRMWEERELERRERRERGE
jgi:hypothetical protein